jgi:hypothetical protein
LYFHTLRDNINTFTIIYAHRSSFLLCPKHVQVQHLLEDLSVSPLVGLAVDSDWLVPTPLVFDERLVLWVGWVELGELVALEVWGNIEGWERFLATDEESTPDDGVVCGSVNGCGTEKVFAAGLESVEESTYSMLAILISMGEQ